MIGVQLVVMQDPPDGAVCGSHVIGDSTCTSGWLFLNTLENLLFDGDGPSMSWTSYVMGWSQGTCFSKLLVKSDERFPLWVASVGKT
jgi:hypothetical protein